MHAQEVGPYTIKSHTLVKEVLRSFTSVKKTIAKCRNTVLQGKVTNSKFYLGLSENANLLDHKPSANFCSLIHFIQSPLPTCS